MLNDVFSWIGTDNNMYLVIAILGGIMGLWHLVQLARVKLSKKWNTTVGVIESAYVQKYDRSGGGRNFKPVVRYSYSVRGKRYESNRIAIGGSFTTNAENFVRKVVDRYPEGSNTKVFYNPNSPDEAVLNTGAPWILRFSLVLDILFVALGSAGYLGYVIDFS